MAEEKEEQGQFFELRPDGQAVIKGFPELRWTGKRPFASTRFFPAQLKEIFGNPSSSGWLNKLFWGDNLQVMSYLLRDYRGKVDMIYVDPPFDSKADYKKKIALRGASAESDLSVFEEKQYGDIWTNDDYLQFMYERLILMRELLSKNGTIYLHCDWHKGHHLRMLMDEVFGPDKFINEVIWHYSGAGTPKGCWAKRHDNIFVYGNGGTPFFNADAVRIPYAAATVERFSHKINNVRNGIDFGEQSLNPLGKYPEDVLEVSIEAPSANIRTGYPTQKPEALVEKLVLASSKPGDLVFDCFMGSGTTMAVCLKNGRRFIGADINLGSVQTTKMRLLNALDQQDLTSTFEKPGFEVYNVNNYDFFRNPQDAKDTIIKLLELQPFDSSSLFDGEKDGRLYKIMPLNRIATKADIKALIDSLPYSVYDKRYAANPNDPVEKITLVCMGHEPDLLGSFKQETQKYNLDVEIHDVLLEDKDIILKREAEANIVRSDGKIIIKSFYPMNLLQKLNMVPESVHDWKQLVDSIFIDWNYDGKVFRPTLPDVPEDQKLLVRGEYTIPANAKNIRVKITDLLSESIEVDVK